MTLTNILSLLGLILLLFGGIWNIIKILLSRDRKTVEDQQKAMWGKLDKLTDDLQDALLEQARMKERIELSPDWEGRIQAMEDRLEKRFDDLAAQFREFYTQAFSMFQQRQG